DVGASADRNARVEVRHSLGIAADALVVGTVARLDPVKDLGTLLEAAALARRPLHLLMVGDGPEKPRLERRAIELGIGSFTRFTGHRTDVRRLLQAMDAFVNC